MMRPTHYATARLLAVLLTALVIAAHQHLPQRTLQLYPDPEQLSWVYGPEHQGSPSADWIEREKGHFHCHYAPGDAYSCGWSLNLGPDRVSGLNLSNFDGFNVVINYKGDAPRLRLYLREFDPTYSDANRAEVTSKFMSTAIRTADLNQPTYVTLNEFRVAEWWITEFDVSREDAAPSLNNVIVFGIDFNVHSKNDVQVERIEAIGERIEKETLYFGIISLWMVLIVLEVFSRFYLIHKKSRADALRINRLASEYKKLELEKQEFEELSTTDVLTGAMNRAGIQQFLQKLFQSDADWSQVGVLLLDIDNFKNINDQLGHDVGDIVLRQLSEIICQSVRQTDVFGRWGGEEFILLCPRISEDRLHAFAEKIRESIERHVFETPTQALDVTVSIGATIVNNREPFEIAFKRADTALYQAKNGGRNQVRICGT